MHLRMVSKHLIAILILSFIEVFTEVNCVAFDARARRLQKSVSITKTSTSNSRRRDINTENGSYRPILERNASRKCLESTWNGSQSKSILREKALKPDMDSAGRPLCLKSPNDTFCEEVNNYPKSYLKDEIGFSPIEFLNIFGTRQIYGRVLVKRYTDNDLSEKRVCGRVTKVIWPKAAKNQANQWIYVVNDVEYTQEVVTEICEKEDKPCDYLDRNLTPGMYSRCRQKYSYKRLLALHPIEKQTYSETFKFPSHCVCYVKSNETVGRSLKTKRKN